MFLKAGALSLALLLASRVLGLLRESAQAAAFGTSGLGDVAVLMLTLPDWLAGVLASGALAYVLLPHWARETPTQQARTQRQVGLGLVGMGVVAGLLLGLCRDLLVPPLASGLRPEFWPVAAQGLVWSAVALPAALLAALWVTRLQHERDFTGLYAANLVVNGVLICALFFVANNDQMAGTTTVLGLGLALAMVLRLLWLHWRLRPFANLPVTPSGDVSPTQPPALPKQSASPSPLPRASLWLWAAFSAGLPLALPFAARSLASGAGEGALATFNYAWKLVELPLVLAIQLVATLAFPAITRAMASVAAGGTTQAKAGSGEQDLPPEAVRAVRSAFALAWTLACAAAAALQFGSFALTSLLFGWGRMGADSLGTVAHWGAIGAWGLLPQALIAVALTVLAALGQMRGAVLAYGLALVALLTWGAAAPPFGDLAGRSGGALQGAGQGAWLMVVLNLVLTGVAVALLVDLHRRTKGTGAKPALVPWRALLVPTVALVALTGLNQGMGGAVFEQKGLLALVFTAFEAIVVIAVSMFFSSELRAALRR